jgi:tetratricopeptide (TPR) repeat protein
MPVSIKRDYRTPFFREKKRGFPLRNLLIVLAGMGALVYALWSQPALMQQASYALLGNAPTPTPLPREWYDRAQNAYFAGDMAGALRAYEEAIAQRPDNLEYLYAYGQLLVDEGRANEALNVVQRMADLNNADVRVAALRARALVWAGQTASAIPVALSGIERDSNFGALYEALARAYAGEARWRDALNAGLMATEKSPNDVRAYWAYASVLARVGSYDQALAELDTAIKLHPFFLPPYFEKAFLLLSLDRNQEAIDLYDRILGIQPRNARALLRQCEAYRKIGEFQRALGLCQDAVANDPTLVAAQFRLGSMLYRDRRFDEALTAFQACFDQAPDNLACRYYLGLANYYVGNCDTGWELLQSSLRTAQTLTNTQDDIATISAGLTAISNDPRCPRYSGRFGTPTPTAPIDPETPAPSAEGDA